MNKDQFMKQLDDKVETMARFINEVLQPRNDTNINLLEDFKKVLANYQKEENIQVLKKLREIESRPIIEGAETDFTSGMSLSLDGQYHSLGELIIDIEDLVFEIEKI